MDMTKFAFNFDIKHRQEIEAGKYKVITDSGEPVEIVKWDCKGDYPILAVIDDGNTHDSEFFFGNGESMSSGGDKLLLVEVGTDEQTPFEKRLAEILDYAMEHPVTKVSQLLVQVKTLSPELMKLAREQYRKELEKDGIRNLISDSALQKMLDDKYKEGYECCQEHDKERIGKARLEGFSEGVAHADKRNKAIPPLIAPFGFPPCYFTWNCTNPHHDCINCPQQGTSGIAKTDTNIK